MSGTPDIAISRASTSERVGASNAGLVGGSADWIMRPLFGFLLAGIAIAATLAGGLAFAVFLAAGCSAGAREWHRFFARQDFLLPTAITVAAMIGALLSQLYGWSWIGRTPAVLPFSFLAAGFACNLVLGLIRRGQALAHAAGAAYIGIPALTLFMLRQLPNHPVWLVVLVFLSVWATDTGALFTGKLIGGPKLAPSLSPNKTWAGSIGGVICAAIIAVVLAVFLKTSLLAAAVFAIVLSVAGQIGDLFESMVKRKRGHKDSGGLIPGHGGVLDRIDSILFAAPVAACLVLVAHLDPLMGLRP